MVKKICTGGVSVVVVRKSNDQFLYRSDQIIAPLLQGLFTKKTQVGNREHKTEVYAFTGSAKRPSACGTQTNVG